MRQLIFKMMSGAPRHRRPPRAACMPPRRERGLQVIRGSHKSYFNFLRSNPTATYILCHAIITAQLGTGSGGVRRGAAAAQAGWGAAAGVRNETHLLVKRLNRISTMTHSHRSFGGQPPSKKSLRSSSGLLLILK
jgi:hypothetical protein